MASVANRAVSAISIGAAACVAGLSVQPGAGEHRPLYLAGLILFGGLAVAGHAASHSLIGSLARVPPGRLRVVSGILATAVAIAVMPAGSRYLGTTGQAAVLALLAAAAAQSFFCITANDSLINGLLGAAIVGISVFSGRSGAPVIPVGIVWAAAFAAQLTFAHRQELATRITHPAGGGDQSMFRASEEPWSKTVAAAVAALVVLALIAALIPPLRGIVGAMGGPGPGAPSNSEEGAEPDERGTPTDTGTRQPNRTATPAPRRTETSAKTPDGVSTFDSTEGEGSKGEFVPASDGYSIDLNRTQPRPDSEVFAVVSAREPRLMRVAVLTEYLGDVLLSPEDRVAKPGRCPCSIAADRAGSAPFVQYDQLVEIIRDYDGALPAAFEPVRLSFHARSEIEISVAEGKVLLPSALVTRGTVYSVGSQVPIEDPNILSELDEPVPAEIADVNTQLPDRYSQRVRDLAAEITKQARTPYQKATAILAYVTEKHRFEESQMRRDPQKDAVERYLFDENSEGIANDAVVASMVLMRTVGIPARVGVGYRPKLLPPSPEPTASPSPAANSVFLIDKAERTTWVEYYIAGFGWVTADIEPILGLQKPAARNSRWIVLALILAVVALAALTTAFILWRRSKKRRLDADENEAGSLMRMLERAVGIERRPSQTPTEYGAVLWSRLPSIDREAAMMVIAAVIRLSYTREPLGEDQRSRVYRALDELKRSRKQREQQRARHAQRRRRSSA